MIHITFQVSTFSRSVRKKPWLTGVVKQDGHMEDQKNILTNLKNCSTWFFENFVPVYLFYSKGSTQNVNKHLIHHAPVANEAVPCRVDNKSNIGKRLPVGWGVTIMFHVLSAYLTPYKVHWKPISINLMSHVHSAQANLGPSCNFIHSIQIL